MFLVDWIFLNGEVKMEAQRRQVIRTVCFNRKRIKKNIETNKSVSDEVIFTVDGMRFIDEETILSFIKSIDSDKNVKLTNYVASKLVDYISEKYIKPYNPYGCRFFSNIFNKNMEIAKAMNSMADEKWLNRMEEFYYINIYSVFIDPKTSKSEKEIFYFVKSVMDSNNTEMVNYIAERLIDYISEKYIKTNDGYGWKFFNKLFDANNKLAKIMCDKADEEWYKGLMNLLQIINKENKKRYDCEESLKEIEKEIKKTEEHYKWLLKRKTCIEKEIEGIRVY